MARIRLGDLLLQAGLIDEMQLQSAVARQRQWGGKLGDVLVTNGFIDEMMLWRGIFTHEEYLKKIETLS